MIIGLSNKALTGGGGIERKRRGNEGRKRRRGGIRVPQNCT